MRFDAGTTAGVPARRAQLEALAAAGEHAQVIAKLFELLERVMREHSDLAMRYTAMLHQMYRSKSGKVLSDQLALFLVQLPANETTTPPDEPPRLGFPGLRGQGDGSPPAPSTGQGVGAGSGGGGCKPVPPVDAARDREGPDSR